VNASATDGEKLKIHKELNLQMFSEEFKRNKTIITKKYLIEKKLEDLNIL